MLLQSLANASWPFCCLGEGEVGNTLLWEKGGGGGQTSKQVLFKGKQVNKMGGGGGLVQVTKKTLFVCINMCKTLENYYKNTSIAKVF